MPSIRDIINAATPGPWAPRLSDYQHDPMWDVVTGYDTSAPVSETWVAWEEAGACEQGDALFIATFDPTHAGLLIEGMTAVLDLVKCPICASKGIDGGHASLCPLGAVEAYWKERGLDG